MTQQLDSEQQYTHLSDGRCSSAPNSAKDAFDALLISIKSFIADGEEKATPKKARRTFLGSGSSILCFLSSLGKKRTHVSDARSAWLDNDYDPVLPPELIKSYPNQFNGRTQSGRG